MRRTAAGHLTMPPECLKKAPMAPKHHPTPLSGGDRKALAKELTRARAVTTVLARRSAELRAEGEALIRKADCLACESWNEKMWADGGPIDPSPLVDQAINGGFPWLEIECSRCKSHRDVDLAILPTLAPPSYMIWPPGCGAASAPTPTSTRDIAAADPAIAPRAAINCAIAVVVRNAASPCQ